MTQEEKQLLLNDLSARLPHGVICQFIWTYNNETTDGEDVVSKENDNIRGIDIHSEEVQADYYGEWVDLEHCKPYLRPMSSMTEEEEIEINEFLGYRKEINGFGDIRCAGWNGDVFVNIDKIYGYLNWLNSHHFDYRDLIEKGLAIEAPEGMYKTE